MSKGIISFISKIVKKRKIEKLKKKLTPSKKYTLENISLDNAQNKSFEDKVEKILQKNLKQPQKLLDFINGAKTPCYKIANANNLLSKIGEQTGFILPQKGLKALYLNLFLNKKIGFSISEIFVVEKTKCDMYSFSYEFYRWYCYKMKAKGFDLDTQKKYKNIFQLTQSAKIDTLSFDEIIELKEAIKKDIDAINFVKKMAMKNQQSKKSLDKIKTGNAISV